MLALRQSHCLPLQGLLKRLIFVGTVTSSVHVEIITLQWLIRQFQKVKFDGNFAFDYQEPVKACPAIRNLM